jgi:hypothetical protein
VILGKVRVILALLELPIQLMEVPIFQSVFNAFQGLGHQEVLVHAIIALPATRIPK